MQMEDAHLAKRNAIQRRFDQKIRATAAEPVPNFRRGSHIGCGPIGVPQIGHHAAQARKVAIFVFHRRLKPVFTVQVNNEATLVEQVFVGKGSSGGEGKVGVAFQQQRGGVVIAKAVVAALPEIGARFGYVLIRSLETGS